jgi:uncharacterized protein YkwD
MMSKDTASLCLDEARPWALARRSAAGVAVAAVALASLSFAPLATAAGHGRERCADAHAPISAAPRAALQRAVVCLIDQQRRDRGLPRLRENSQLNRSAQGWTNTMVDNRNFGHGADFAARISAAGFHWSSAGENIATGFETPADVVHAWMGSAGHCQNILNPTYRFVGTGVRNRPVAGFSNGYGTWTQDFALKMGESPASGNWGPADGCPYG